MDEMFVARTNTGEIFSALLADLNGAVPLNGRNAT